MKHLTIATEAGIRTVTINRPDKLNALNRRTLHELDEAVDQAGKDLDVRVLVITGAGEKAFVAGADITEIRNQSATEARRFSQLGQDLMSRIENLDKPVIASIRGFALGGGMELALACHLRIASASARLGLPEIKLGIMPGFGGTQRLVRLVGTTRALGMVLSGEPIDADRALDLGLVNQVIPADQLDQTVRTLAAALAAAAPEAVRGILQAILRGAETSMETGLALETARFALCCATEDMREGTQAFLDKRQAKFSGR